MSGLTLTIDTASEACSVGLFNGEQMLASRFEQPGVGHAERLPHQLDQLWREASLTPDQLARIVVTTGPGSFTGLRIGLSAAKALALASGATLVGVSTLAALAATVAAESAQPPARLVTAVDARRGELYWQSWSWIPAQGCYRAEVPAQVVAQDEASALLAGPAWVAGTGAALLAGCRPVAVTHPAPPGVGLAADWAGERLALDASPVYLRPHDARPLPAHA